MAKFKKGERVRLATYPEPDYFQCSALSVGMIGTVTEESHRPYVAWDGLTAGHSGTSSDYAASNQWAVGEALLVAADSAVSQQTLADVVAVLIAAGIVTQAQVDAANALIGGAA
jgi:hypothetical protein